MGDFAVQCDGLDGSVCLEHDGAAGGFVAAARLHADVAVLHQVETADAVLAAEFIQFGQDLCGRKFRAIERHDIAVGEFEIKVFGLVRCIFRRYRPAPHALFGFGGGVFQMAAFVGNVQQVGVHGVGRTALLVLHVDRNAVLLGIGHQFFARQQIPFAPRRDDFDAGLECIGTQFEAHLVVALSGSAVRDRISTGEVGDFDQALGDQRTRDGSAEQVFAFVHGIGAEHRKYEIAHEFFAQIVDEDVIRLDAEFQRLLACGFQFLALAEVGGEGDYLALVGILQPLQDDRSVESAGIGEDGFFDVAHACFFLS